MKTVTEIRAEFPALQRKHGGRTVAYFDGPGGTQVPQMVASAVTDYLFNHNANTHWAYPTSAETDEMLADARTTFGHFLNADADEIVFGANMTTLTFHLARALVRRWRAGDEVVITELDHHANVAPWQALARDCGIVIRTIPLNPQSGLLELDSLSEIITPRCRLLAIGAASNALGTVSELNKPIAAAKAAGALVFIDAVHYAPHFLVDVKQLQCDFLGCSAYKFYGPHVGILYVRKAILDTLDPPKLIPAPDDGPEKLETGTLNHEGIIGAAAAVRFLASIGDGDDERSKLASAYAVLHERSRQQVARLWDGLNDIPGLRCFGPSPSLTRSPTIGFVCEGVSSTSVAEQLAAQGLFLSHGDFYAKTVIDRLGLGEEGLVRAGCACYTSDDEIDALLGYVRKIAAAISP